MAKHLGILPLYKLKDLSEFNYSSLKTAKLIDSVHVNKIPRGHLSTNMQNIVESDLYLNSTKMDESTVTDIKPDIKDLSDIISNSDTYTVSSNIIPFIKYDLTNMENVENMSLNLNQGKIKQENKSLSESSCRVKEEIMYCQSCSYSDMEINRMKFHIFREHPTGAAVVANSFDKANCYLYDIILLCVKVTCSFSTPQCNVYEEHLMSCCQLHETLSEDETERLKSTVIFILDLKNKHNLNTVPGFLDYFSTFNTTFSCEADKVQINKDLEYNSSFVLSGPESVVDDSVSCSYPGIKFENSVSSIPTPVLLLTTQNTDFNRTVCKTENISLFEGEQERKPEQLSKPDSCNETFTSLSGGKTAFIQPAHELDVSANIALEFDVAGSPVDINSLKEETKENKIKEMKMYSSADCCNTDQHISNQQSGCVTRMTTEIQPINHTSDLYDDVMKNNRDHFSSNLKLSSRDLHFDMKKESDKQSFKIDEYVEQCGDRMDLLQHKRNYTKEKPFKCNDCEKTFSQNGHLIVHMRTHTGERPFKCNDCEKTFTVNSNLIEHMRTHTGEKPFKCNYCEKTFSVNSNLIKHLRTHTGEKPFKCNDCEKTFSQNGHLIVHMRTHTGEKPFKCNNCEKTFSLKSHLINHMRTHTGEKPFKCNDCEKTFSLKSHLMNHMRRHTREKPFKCNDCEKTFSRNSNLNMHIRTHTVEKPFQCNDCGRIFGQSNHLINHRRTHTGEKPFKCNNCEKTFNCISSLNRHMRTHTGEKPFKCSECDKTFCQHIQLIVHIRTHTGEKPFKCNECDKTFIRNSELNIHMRTHTGEKPFRCYDCGKTFSRHCDLNEHMRTHTGEKPFKCNDCEKTFSRNSDLNKHMRTHTGEKPFKCNVCEKAFSQNSDLNIHMRTHTGEKPFKCNYCRKVFGHHSSLIKHMTTHS